MFIIAEDWDDGANFRWVGQHLLFELSLAEEKAEWKPFRNALDKSE